MPTTDEHVDFRLVTTYTPTLFLCARAIGMLGAAESALMGSRALSSYSPRPVWQSTVAFCLLFNK
jgi:hypothetical protein